MLSSQCAGFRVQTTETQQSAAAKQGPGGLLEGFSVKNEPAGTKTCDILDKV
jgi:hypothetical protein